MVLSNCASSRDAYYSSVHSHKRFILLRKEIVEGNRGYRILRTNKETDLVIKITHRILQCTTTSMLLLQLLLRLPAPRSVSFTSRMRNTNYRKKHNLITTARAFINDHHHPALKHSPMHNYTRDTLERINQGRLDVLG